jgi:hypothetical protein
MARITDSEFNTAEVGNIEKINGDYFTKVINADSNGDFISTSNPLPTKLMSGLVPESYDELLLGYTNSVLTSVTYKKATVTIATLTFTYTDGNLTGVVRT